MLTKRATVNLKSVDIYPGAGHGKYDIMHEPAEFFRFLDLPTELRLMVYEYLPNRTRRIEFVKMDGEKVNTSFTLIINSAPTTILRTCRLIHQEAERIVHRFLNTPGDDGPAPRLEAEVRALGALGTTTGVLIEIVGWYNTILYSNPEDHEAIETSIQVQLNSFLAVHEYRLKEGTAEQGRLELARFVRKAGWALAHQKRMSEAQNTKQCLDDASKLRPTNKPEVHIALRTESDTELSRVRMAVYRVSRTMALIGGGPGFNTRIHLLEQNMKRFEEEQAWMSEVKGGERTALLGDGSFAPFRNLVSAGSSHLGREKVYELLWKDGEFL